MAKYNPRYDRINEEYKKELTQIINTKLKNPNVKAMVTVTKVKVSHDLSYAKVYVSLMNSRNISSKNIDDTMVALKKSAGFLRSELARTINQRKTPELVFTLDDSLEYGYRIDELLKQVMPKKEKVEENKEENIEVNKIETNKED